MGYNLACFTILHIPKIYTTTKSSFTNKWQPLMTNLLKNEMYITILFVFSWATNCFMFQKDYYYYY